MDVKAGGGQMMRLGMILRQWLVKLEWFSTLFPRIPVPIQQKIQKLLDVSFTLYFFQLLIKTFYIDQERFPSQAQASTNYREERNDRNWNSTGGATAGTGAGGGSVRNFERGEFSSRTEDKDEKDRYRDRRDRGEHYNREYDRRDRERLMKHKSPYRETYRDRSDRSPKRDRSPNGSNDRDRYRHPSRVAVHKYNKRDKYRR